MIKANFHLLGIIEPLFQPGSAAENNVNANRLKPCRGYAAEWWRTSKFKAEQAHNFSLSCRSGTDLRQQPEPIYDNKHQKI